MSISDLIKRLQIAVSAMRVDSYVDTNKVSFIALSKTGGGVERVEIISSAHRQIEMMKKGLIGPQPAFIPYSAKYLKWRIKKGLASTPTWTLVRTGLLYRSLAYYIQRGELYVEYSDKRKDAIRYLNTRAGFHVLDTPRSHLVEIAKAFQASRISKFVDAIRGRNG